MCGLLFGLYGFIVFHVPLLLLHLFLLIDGEQDILFRLLLLLDEEKDLSLSFSLSLSLYLYIYLSSFLEEEEEEGE